MRRFWKIWYKVFPPNTLGEVHKMQARVFGFTFLDIPLAKLQPCDLRGVPKMVYVEDILG